MDITLARTFLMIADTGSFIEAARRMNVTQSTVSARVKTLEDLLGRPVFERTKAGAALTPAGQQFRRHAMALVRVWQHAQLDVGLAEEHRDHLTVGAPAVLWPGFLIRWVTWLRRTVPHIAVSTACLQSAQITQRLGEGTLDLAVTYRPLQLPGIAAEHLFDEAYIMVTSEPDGGKRSADYVLIDWGEEFQLDHSAAYPDLRSPSLALDVGTGALDYILANPSLAYVPLRLARAHMGERGGERGGDRSPSGKERSGPAKPARARGRLRPARRGRRFVHPVYMLYPEARDEAAYEPILTGLRAAAQRIARTLES